MRLPFLIAFAPALLAAAPPAPSPAGAEANRQAKAPPPDGGPPALRAATGPVDAGDAIRRILLGPYAQATGTRPDSVPWDGGIESLRQMQSSHAADLALVDGATLVAGCAGQVFEKLDWTRLVRTRFLAATASDCGAGAFTDATVLAWDQAKLPQEKGGSDPGWADFWDVAKHPGRRGLQRGARGNLEIALLADGVQPGDIYKTLRSADGLDRAFRKLDQLKPYILWWDQPAQPAQLLAAGKVLLTSAPASTLAPTLAPPGSHVKLGVQWAGSLGVVKSWVVLQGAPHDPALAALLIATDPAREVELARASGLGPTTTDAATLMPTPLRAASPGLEANFRAGLPIDETFWQDNHGPLEARFNTWLTSSPH